jgi:hypothetical protein
MSDSVDAIDYDRIWAHVDGLPWCVLVTTGRAGTDFFQSLLDSHPEISVFNGSHFFHQFWASARSVTYDGPLILDDIVDEYIGSHIHKLRTRYDVVERKGELGENADQEIAIDRPLFRTHVSGLIGDREVNSRNVLIAVMCAFDMCIGRDMMRRKVLLHHVHRIGRVAHFQADFPNTKVLCMVRDPRANYVSGVEHWRKYEPKTDNPSYPIYIIWRAIDEMSQLRDMPDEAIAALRLEDLGDRDTLKTFCDWVGISYDGALEKSTWGGLRWWGDRLSERKIPKEETGYSPTMVRNRWQERLGRVDQFVLNHLLTPMLDTYGYSRGAGSGAGWAPLVALAILLPTIYERRYLAPGYLFHAVRRRDIRAMIRAFWHPLRRMRLFYSWLARRHFGEYIAPRWLHANAEPGVARRQ